MNPENQSHPESSRGGATNKTPRGRGWLIYGTAVVLALMLAWTIQRNWRRQSGSSAPTGPSSLPAQVLAEMPQTPFVDITRASGITFVHANGAYGDKLLPETMGGGVAFLDFDQDGSQDLLFINSGSWRWQKPAEPGPGAALYRNDGRGRFTDVTAGSGLELDLYGMGVAVGDYDNDGLPDVCITGVGGNRLFHNLGHGRFADITVTAGVGGASNDWSTSAAWIDYDNDGDLDLFICHYVRWSKETDLEKGYKINGVTRAYGPPTGFEGTFPSLYRNDGNGRFTDVSSSSGIQLTHPATGRPLAKSLAIAPIDADNDGWIDIVVANDTVQNFLLRNRHDGTFEEIGSRAGIAFDAYGTARGAMGIDSARFRNDEALGIAIGNFADEMNALYVAPRNDLLFADEAVKEGVGPASQLLLKFGLFFFDFDLDGRLDVLTTNGHLEENIQTYQPKQRYRQPAQLFWNRGITRGFAPVPPEKCGVDLLKPMVGRGSAFADIDGDGDLDVVMTQIGGAPILLRNDQHLGHHWLRLQLVGRKSNRSAIGAWIRVRIGSQTLARQVMPTRSYLSQSELPVVFGLGRADHVDDVTILWPGGAAQKVSGLRLDALNVIEQQ